MEILVFTATCFLGLHVQLAQKRGGIWAHQGDGLSHLPVLGQTGLTAVPEEQAQRKRSFGEGDSSLLTLQLLCCSQTPDSREVASYPWGSPPLPQMPGGNKAGGPAG